MCRGCGSLRGLHVDHVIPRVEGGTAHPSNLQTLCAACHVVKHGGILVTKKGADFNSGGNL